MGAQIGLPPIPTKIVHLSDVDLDGVENGDTLVWLNGKVVPGEASSTDGVALLDEANVFTQPNQFTRVGIGGAADEGSHIFIHQSGLTPNNPFIPVRVQVQVVDGSSIYGATYDAESWSDDPEVVTDVIAGSVGNALNTGVGSANLMIGMDSTAANTSIGTVTMAIGARGQISNSNGIIVDGVGLQATVLNFGSITNAYGLHISGFQNEGTVENSYGVYIGSSIAIGQTTSWAFYSASGLRSRFSGDLVSTGDFEASSIVGDTVWAAQRIAPDHLGSGLPSADTVLYGDGSWGPVPGGSGDTFPDPTGHEGEFLSNDGTDFFWDTPMTGGGGSLDGLESEVIVSTVHFRPIPPNQGVVSIVGVGMEIAGGDAVAGTSGNNAADGMDLTIRAGNAAFIGSGQNANGGHLILMSGARVGGFSNGLVRLGTGGSIWWDVTGDGNFRNATGNGGTAIIRSDVGSDVLPVYTFTSDTKTGIGHKANGQLSIITSPNNDTAGVEAGRFDLSETGSRFWLYDADDGTMRHVVFGADDSGGSGFKLLRVIN